MAANGCSGGMDALAKIVNRLRGEGKNHPLAFTGCCDAHDLFYEQGARWPGRNLAGLAWTSSLSGMSAGSHPG